MSNFEAIESKDERQRRGERGKGRRAIVKGKHEYISLRDKGEIIVRDGYSTNLIEARRGSRTRDKTQERGTTEHKGLNVGARP